MSMIIGWAIDQTESVENTQPLPQQNQQSMLRRLMGEKNRLKAERAWFLSRGEESGA
jgi:hypothetical protein